MKIPENVINAINKMFLCSNLTEHLACYQHFYDDLKECTFVVFSENEGIKLPEALCTNYDNNFAIINVGYENRFYAINRKIYEEMLRTGKSDYYIDVCVELDTQAVSYLNNIFVEYNQILDYDKIKALIEYLQLPEVNYSCIPYLVENAKKKDINKFDCYENIKSFMLFKSFNYFDFVQNGICKFDRKEEDIQLDVDDLYKVMFSERFAQYYENFFRLHNLIYVLLIKAICIEFFNSKKSAQNKIMELFNFVNEKLGFIPERELEVCYYYFKHDNKTKKFFKRVQKNSNGLLNSINGMAWDLIHVRLIEKEFTVRPIDKVEFAIHVLLTFDNGLKEILQINPVEQIAFYKEVTIPKLRHVWIDEIQGAEVKLFSKDNIRKRKQTLESVNVSKLKTVLENELISLCRNMKK